MDLARAPIVRRARQALARLPFALAALVVLLGVLRSGATYFRCPAMDRVLTAPCCGEHAEHEDDVDRAAAVDRPECCQPKRLGDVPAGATTPAPVVALAPVVSVVPAAALEVDLADRSARVRFTHPARAGPPSSRRADLMIWNC